MEKLLIVKCKSMIRVLRLIMFVVGCPARRMEMLCVCWIRASKFPAEVFSIMTNKQPISVWASKFTPNNYYWVVRLLHVVSIQFRDSALTLSPLLMRFFCVALVSREPPDVPFECFAEIAGESFTTCFTAVEQHLIARWGETVRLNPQK